MAISMMAAAAAGGVLSLGGWELDVSGEASVAVGAFDADGAVETGDAVLDGRLDLTADTVLDRGWEIQIGLGGRGQVDREGRSGPFEAVGLCPGGAADCATVVVDGGAAPLIGLGTGLFTAGRIGEDRTGLALDEAYISVRTGWGEWVLGREDGAAAIVAAQAPSLFRTSGAVDLSGMPAVRAVNDLSGFSAKLTYLAPQIGGGAVGKFAFGASFTPEREGCGPDYCAEPDRGPGDPYLPEIGAVSEAALGYSRRAGEWRLRGSVSYAAGELDRSAPGLADVDVWSAGAAAQRGAWSGGLSVVQSNNAAAGDLGATVFEAGVMRSGDGWRAGLAGGLADDALTHVSVKTLTLGGGFALNETVDLAGGLSFGERNSPWAGVPGPRSQQEDNTLGIFLESTIDF